MNTLSQIKKKIKPWTEKNKTIQNKKWKMKARIKVNVIVQKLILKCENVIHAEVIL